MTSKNRAKTPRNQRQILQKLQHRQGEHVRTSNFQHPPPPTDISPTISSPTRPRHFAFSSDSLGSLERHERNERQPHHLLLSRMNSGYSQVSSPDGYTIFFQLKSCELTFQLGA